MERVSLYRRAVAAEVACDSASTWLDSEPLRDAARVIAELRALVPAARLHAPPDADSQSASAPVRDEQAEPARADGSDTSREAAPWPDEIVLDLAHATVEEIAALALAERRSDPPETALRHERAEQWLREPSAAERWGRALGLVLCCVSGLLVLGLGYYAALSLWYVL